MFIQLNGCQMTLASALTLTQLLHKRSIDARGIAIAVNERLVPRTRWSSVIIQKGDRIEIIHAVEGG
jgi:sulfur carrier protein